jgi:hypothetical protein
MENLVNINKKILETFNLLKTRPLMILANDSNYANVQNYIEGYVQGLSHFGNIDLMTKINGWYEKKVKKRIAVHWTCHIPTQYKNKNDDELKQILLNITEEYFIENPLQSIFLD